jgi:hypothetical protein
MGGMNAVFAEKVRVYMQIGDKMFDISGDVRSFSVTQPTIDITTYEDDIPKYINSQFIEADIHMVGTGAWSLVDNFIPKVKKETAEWKCDFCGHVNPMKARYCGHKDKHAVGCGARRSFLLEM